jgi:hypothetical protein
MADLITQNSVWMDRNPQAGPGRRKLYRRLIRISEVTSQHVFGQSFWQYRTAENASWKDDPDSKARPTRISRTVFELRFERLFPAPGDLETELRQQIAAQILDESARHPGAMYAPDAFAIAARIALGQDPDGATDTHTKTTETTAVVAAETSMDRSVQ